MAENILMPRQGNTVETCTLMKWRVKAGDTVTPKTIVADVETDKATFEVAAGCSGIILKLVHAEGEDVPVMQTIAIVGAVGEDISGMVGSPGAAPAIADSPATAEPLITTHNRTGSVSAQASPRARALATARGVDLTGRIGSGPQGRVIERDVQAILGNSAPSSAAAIEAAGKRGVPLPTHGSGLGGRITLADLSDTALVAPTIPGKHPEFPGPKTETTIKGIRKIIADRMAESLATTAQFTLNASALAVHLQALRSRFKLSDPALGLSDITIGDIVVCAAARTLKQFPYMNAHKVGDSIFEFEHVHIGIACDTPRGLMVPVLRNADVLSLHEISEETRRLADACRNGTIRPEELSGSTFSVSNLGNMGIESFTPVLNIPEVAILGVCSISLKPVQGENAVEFLPMIGLSLTINHMAVDGAPAARFLKSLCQAIAECDILLAK